MLAERVDVTTLEPYPGNPRRGNVAVIAASLSALGQYRPIVVQTGTRYVLAGNHTLAAAKQLGWEDIDVVWVDADEATARKIVAADNRASDLGEYDSAELLALLEDVEDLEGTGYEVADLAELVAIVNPEPPASPVGFSEYDEEIDTEYRCPKCAYEWSGKPR
jgi:ParB-like chromosome segregation protein Spo0J